MRLSNPRFAEFFARNGEFDLLTFDFHDPDARARLDLADDDPEAIEELRAYQRLLRLEPDEQVADRLLDAGFTSAHEIAAVPEPRFVREYAETLGDAETARRVHRRAAHVRAVVRHLAAVARDVGSPFSRAMRSYNVDDDLVEYLTGIPSYQTLFGGLDHCACEHCQSLYGPGAYFVDIMRITDEYITEPNAIPDGYKLEDRRPDLFTMEIDCENTNTVIPYLVLVNEILASKIGADTQTDAFQTLAVAGYPFNLPFNLPLTQMRRYLAELDVTLDQIFARCVAPATSGTAQGGGNASGGNPPFVTLADSASSEDETYADMYVSILAGTGAGQRRTILAYTGATRTASVDSDWDAGGVPDATSQYIIVDPTDVGRERLGLSIERFDLVTTPNASEAGVEASYGYRAGQVFLLPYAAGPGTISVTAGSDTVTGVGVVFGTDVRVGDEIAVGDEIRTVAAIASATSLTVDSDWAVSSTDAAYQISKWLDGDGAITFAADSVKATIATPGGTPNVAVGAYVQAAGIVREVIQVDAASPSVDEATIIVDGPWGAAASSVAYTFNPPSNLGRLKTFVERTGLSRDQVLALFIQGTSEAERAAGVDETFFINDTGERLEALTVVTDEANPFASHEKIVGLSLDRLDRVNRFARLATWIGWTFAELNWALVAINPAPKPSEPYKTSTITVPAIDALATIALLKQQSGLSVEELCAFWYDLKTIGRGDGAHPDDLFDRVYNRPALLDGQNPYDPNTAPIPFDPARPLSWKVDPDGGATSVEALRETAPSPDSSNATIRSRLTGALFVSDDDLTAVGNYALALLGIEDGTLTLDLPTLTLLYRLTRQASAFDVPVVSYLELLTLVYLEPAESLCSDSWTPPPEPEPTPLPPPSGLPFSIPSTVLWQATAKWLNASPFTVPQLRLSLTGQQSKAAPYPFTDAGVRGLIESLATVTSGIRLTWESFVFENVKSDASAAIFDTLETDGYINSYGIVLDKVAVFTYDDVSYLFPVTEESFITSDITAEQSAEAFSALTQHDPPYVVPSPVKPEIHVVAESFTENDPLDFLFPGAPNAAAMQLEVQVILLQHKKDGANTRKVLDHAMTDQEQHAAEGLSGFLDISSELLYALLVFTQHAPDLAAFRGALLTPLVDGDPARRSVECLAETLYRALVWVNALAFTAYEVAAIAASSKPFGVANTAALTLADVESLSLYKALDRAFMARPNALVDYFAATVPEAPAAKYARLSTITGWSVDQIAFLSRLFWPLGAEVSPNSYDTVSGVERLKLCFDLGDRMGVDVYFLMNVYAISNLPLTAPGGGLRTESWELYVARARNLLDIVHQHLDDEAFATAYAAISSTLETLERDALLGYAIWYLSADFPFLRTPSDLYQWLLVDVEMSSCATTLRIAEGISSVQLYMQRVRMNVEPFITKIEIPDVWWEWMSSYRVWEANRKVFLYPENYVDPSLRRDATPLYKKLAEDLQTSDVGNATASEALGDYFARLTELAGLVHVSSVTYKRYNATAKADDTVLVLVARTSTEPYTYYIREVVEASSCAGPSALVWEPWTKIDVTIKSPYATVGYAFERPFIFWIEQNTITSSLIANSNSAPNIVYKSTIRYSFLDQQGRWIQPQTLLADVPVRVSPNDYAPAKDSSIDSLFAPQQLAWRQPCVMTVARGLVGAGTLTFSGSFNVAQGTNTDVERQVKQGDQIWCAGVQRTVAGVTADQEIIVEGTWGVSATNAPYRVIPADPTLTRYPAFAGPGTVQIFASLQLVTGTGTEFLSDVAPGDVIRVGTQNRTVVSITSDTELLVDVAWSTASLDAPYTVVPSGRGDERLLFFFGNPLDVGAVTAAPTKPVETANTEDSFVRNREAFNMALYDSLLTSFTAANMQPTPGLVTLSLAAAIDPDLQVSDLNIWLQTDQGDPQAYSALVDPDTRTLVVAVGDSLIAQSYWDNRSPASRAPITSPASGRPLLYNIAPAVASAFSVANHPGWYVYNNGDETFAFRTEESNVVETEELVFARPFPNPAYLTSRPAISLAAGPYTSTPQSFGAITFRVNRLTTRGVGVMSQRLFAGGVERLLTLENQYTLELPFSRFYESADGGPPQTLDPKHLPSPTIEFEGAYGPYYWEVFFFAPFLVADSLRTNQRFDEARLWLEYIFNPTQPPDPSLPNQNDRYWRFRPFRDLTRERLVDVLTSCAQIARYNEDPFDPNGIARLRPTAFAKAIVLRYIDNLLQWGDSLYSQDTRESINQATLLYVMASDLLGPRPVTRGPCPTPEPATFAEIKAHYPDGIPEFLIDLENTPVTANVGCCQMQDIPLLDVQSYFCFPENSDLIRYWDLVEDRLFKIRHCMNIQGVERQLALFAPPIDPRQLIARAASGQSGVSVERAAEAPIPYYRFEVTLERAKAFVAAVTQLGSSLLLALERADGEELALLRNTQERTLLDLTTQVKTQQVEQAQRVGESLEYSRQNAAARSEFYNSLLATGLSPAERLNLMATTLANYFNLMGSTLKTMAGVAHLVPNVGSPFAMTYGGAQVGSSLNAIGSFFELMGGYQSFIATLSGTMATYERRAQEWQLQAQLAALDEQQIAAQIAANDLALSIAERELETHLETIQQNEEMEAFLEGKFTNLELYQWMVARLSAIYFQAYSLAFDVARSAERAFQYELNSKQTFINFGYWDSLRKGLLAGDGLGLALGQMEKAYFDANSRPLEIQRTIALSQVNPRALLDLKTTGKCNFELSEELFDLDFPGHYARKIKTLSVSIPAVVAPYQRVKATLTQMSNQVVLQPKADAVKFLLGQGGTALPASLRSNVWINQEIVLSTGVEDSGMFEPSLSDPRYLPFEGTGAVSTWQLSLPTATNHFDFDTITDVVVQLKYTALDGGQKFRDEVQTAVTSTTGGVLFSLSQTYSQQWYAFMTDHSNTAEQSMTFDVPAQALPRWLSQAKMTGIYVQLDVAQDVDASSNTPYITLDYANGEDPVELPIARNNGGYVELTNPVDLGLAAGARRITFKLGQNGTPSVLLGPDEFLDPAVLTNIGLIFYYTGEIKWR